MNNIFKIALCTALLGVTGCSYTASTHRPGYNPGYRTNYIAPSPRYAPPPRYVPPPRYYDSRNYRGNSRYHRDYHGHRRW